ncbi:MAG: class I SAM-dependent methyltransferase [Bacteroidota bacterium]
MSLNDFTSNLELKDGIWFSSDVKKISYPKAGNDAYYQVEENSFWFKHRNNCIVELLSRFPPNGAIFDVGGGNGFVSKRIQSEGYEAVLVEPGIAGVLNAKRRNLKNVICSTLEGVKAESNSLPAIGVFDVVEHLPDDMAFLKTAYELLVEGGKIYITVPAYNTLWSQDDVDAGHYRRYTIKSINKKLQSLNFEIEFSTYMFSILPFPIFLFRTIPSLFSKKSNSPDKHSNIQEDHIQDNKLLERIWWWELSRVKKLTKIPFGSSCLLVASKK